ncbi:MAG TPA: serine/threonine-protein kinase, partial [Longimicrobiaceae bacterium]|nr:serine/threonine-protein kinase [Longimicrobiaceae bacterium]
MKADDRLGELFERALDVSPADRDAFLEGACADPDLRAEVRSLLRFHESSPEFLEYLGEQLLPGAFAARARAKAGPDALTGQRTVGRYTLLEELGRGGMGVVYKAYDPDLQRAVALKFLPAHLSADPEARARMRSEARAASALDHANIAVVYEIGSTRLDQTDPAEGRLYIAMAYYDGETLARKIARGPLPPAAVLDYGAQIASGLSRAHAAGIVHRDVKPANLIVTERGELKILDFGIARVASGTLTRAGTPVGTVAYMSPEQTRGDVVDARADVWAVGAVLHEMLQAQPAFARASDKATIYAIRNDHPARILALSEGSRPGIQDLIDRCLAKDPSSRPADGGALLEEIERVRRGVGSTAAARDASTGDPRSSLVVLPFRNLSADPQDEYFSDGLTEEVVADLTHVRTLRVISRTSSMRLKGSD